MKIQLKRVYETESPEDGFRILADRLWPRGIKKEALHLDFWAKEVAPPQLCANVIIKTANSKILKQITPKNSW